MEIDNRKVLEEAGISEDVRVKDLTEEQLNAIRKTIDAIKVEGDLRRSTIKHQEIDGNWMLQRNTSQKGLPVRGQRTKRQTQEHVKEKPRQWLTRRSK